MKSYLKTPFPWFGGKSRAAPLIWQLLGDVPHYIEPFFGSGAALLLRPHRVNRPYYSETGNDADGLVTNFWRSVQWFPGETARHASWPITEADKNACQLRFRQWRDEVDLERLAGDATYCDPLIAGWWAWGISIQIGAVGGSWVSDPRTGRLIHHPGSNGISRSVPKVNGDGSGPFTPQTRHPGVSPLTALDRMADDPDAWADTYHDLVQPELLRWLRYLSARLRHVRFLSGDWARAVTPGVMYGPSVRAGKGPCGIFLDPPYAATAGRSKGLYLSDSLDVAYLARDWALAHGDDPWLRIVMAGFDGEHDEEGFAEAGWTTHEWFVDAWYAGGLQGEGGTHQMHRERLWASPGCLTPDAMPEQPSLFEVA